MTWTLHNMLLSYLGLDFLLISYILLTHLRVLLLLLWLLLLLLMLHRISEIQGQIREWSIVLRFLLFHDIQVYVPIGLLVLLHGGLLLGKYHLLR